MHARPAAARSIGDSSHARADGGNRPGIRWRAGSACMRPRSRAGVRTHWTDGEGAAAVTASHREQELGRGASHLAAWSVAGDLLVEPAQDSDPLGRDQAVDPGSADSSRHSTSSVRDALPSPRGPSSINGETSWAKCPSRRCARPLGPFRAVARGWPIGSRSSAGSVMRR